MVQTLERNTCEGAALDVPVPFRRILVPLDGSPLAERALPFARCLAHLVRGDMIFVRAATVRGPRYNQAAAETGEADEAATYLERLVRSLSPDYSLEVSVPTGEPSAEIANVARLRGADLIVMTTHGRSGLGRLLLGSVADRLVRRTALPLLLVRADLPLRRWDCGLNRILVPLDGSDLAESILPKVAVLAQAAGARITLLQVVGPAMPELRAYEIAYLPSDDDILADQARAYLARAAAQLTERGLEVTTEVVFGSPAEQISALTRKHQYDLLAMSTHARDGLDRLIMGSVADEVLRSGEVPLLLFRQ